MTSRLVDDALNVDDPAQRWWGPRWRSRIGRALGIVLCLSILFSRPLITEDSWLDLSFETVGWLAWILGGTVRFWATLYIGGRKSKGLVDDGPYSLCRNPLYLGSLLLGLSAALFLHSLTFALALGVIMILYARGTVPDEEAHLRRVAGNAYADYCRRVPRYWPRLSGFRTPPIVAVNLTALGREYRRAMLWLWLPLAAEVVNRLQGESWWPHLIRLP